MPHPRPPERINYLQGTEESTLASDYEALKKSFPEKIKGTNKEGKYRPYRRPLRSAFKLGLAGPSFVLALHLAHIQLALHTSLILFTLPVSFLLLVALWISFSKQPEKKYRERLIEIDKYEQAIEESGDLEEKESLTTRLKKMKEACEDESCLRSYEVTGVDKAIKVINCHRFLNIQDEITITLCEQEYQQLQEFGVTLKRNPTLLAKLIGHLGAYKADVYMKFFQHGLKTDQLADKLALHTKTVGRLRTLESIEAMYGHSINDLKTAVKTYISEQTDSSSDKVEAQSFLAQLNRQYSTKASSETTQPLLADSVYDTDTTRSLVADWVRERAYRILEDAKRDNELLTLSGKWTFGRGRLHSAITNAQYECRHYAFDPIQPITRAYQGHFQGQQTISTRELGTRGKRDIQRTAFAMAHHMAGAPKPTHYQAHAKPVLSRGWATWFRSKENEIKAGSENVPDGPELAPQRVMHFYYKIVGDYRGISSNMGESVVDFFHELAIIIDGAWDSIKVACSAFAEGFVDALSTAAEKIDGDFSYLRTAQSNASTSHTSDTKTDNEEKEEEECPQKQASAAPHYNVAPLLKNISGFRAFSPHTPLSDLCDLLYTTSGVFERGFAESPTTWTVATGLYALVGLAAINPTLIKTFFAHTPGGPTFADELCKVAGAVGGAFDRSAGGQFVSAGSTAMQVSIGTVDAALNGSDGFLARYTGDINDNLPLAVAIVSLSYLTGRFAIEGGALGPISRTLQEEVGNVPFFAYTFAGAKLAGLSYELFSHKPGENSTIHNCVKTALNLAFNLIRAGLSALHLLFAVISLLYAIPTKNWTFTQKAWHCFTRPWRDLLDTFILCTLALLNFIVQIVTLAVIGITTIIQAALEMVINLLANITPTPVSKAIVNFKSFCARAYDWLSRPFRNAGRDLATYYARQRLRPEMRFGDSEINHAALAASAQKLAHRLSTGSTGSREGTTQTRGETHFSAAASLQAGYVPQ